MLSSATHLGVEGWGVQGLGLGSGIRVWGFELFVYAVFVGLVE